jgi:hypothetical protein
MSRRCIRQSFAGLFSGMACIVIAVALLLATGIPGCAPGRCTSIETFGNLGPAINTPYDEYAPAMSDTAMLIFTSNRIESGRGGIRDQYSLVRPTRLYFSMRLESQWDAAQLYHLLVGQKEEEAATIALAPAGSPFKTIAYVGACARTNSTGGCDIYAVTDGENGGFVNLGTTINSSGWDGQPYVTPDGEHLYFASDRPGGFGGTDIWISDRLPSGAWDAPRNAGPAVNTAGDELSPFYDVAHARLYFAAQTPAGFDIFTLDSNHTERTALSRPYNSEADDFTPFVIGNMLYLASNRPGGCGGYDLYAFPLP